MPAKQIFCKKCHRLAAEIRTDGDKIQIVQGGKTIISMSSKSTGSNIGVRCPGGHNVKVEI